MNGYSTPPILLPFHTKQVGREYSFDVNVFDENTYSVDIRFFSLNPDGDISLRYENGKKIEDAKKLHEGLGGGRFVNHKWVEKGVPVKFRLQIKDKRNNKVILSSFIESPKSLPMYMGRYAPLCSVYLKSGIFNVRIKYVEGGEVLSQFYSEISFAKAHHGK